MAPGWRGLTTAGGWMGLAGGFLDCSSRGSLWPVPVLALRCQGVAHHLDDVEQLLLGVHAKLAIHIGGVSLCRLKRDAELAGYKLAIATAAKQSADIEFAGREGIVIADSLHDLTVVIDL